MVAMVTVPGQRVRFTSRALRYATVFLAISVSSCGDWTDDSVIVENSEANPDHDEPTTLTGDVNGEPFTLVLTTRDGGEWCLEFDMEGFNALDVLGQQPDGESHRDMPDLPEDMQSIPCTANPMDVADSAWDAVVVPQVKTLENQSVLYGRAAPDLRHGRVRSVDGAESELAMGESGLFAGSVSATTPLAEVVFDGSAGSTYSCTFSDDIPGLLNVSLGDCRSEPADT